MKLRSRLSSELVTGLAFVVLALLAHAVLPVRIFSAPRPPLRFLGDKDYPPIAYLDDGVVKGMDVELVHAIGKVMNRPFVIELMDWNLAQVKVRQGEGDALLGMSITESRRKLYDFATVTFTREFGLLVRTDNITIHDLSDLKDKVVGVTAGGFPRHYLEERGGVPLRIVDNYQDGLARLKNGELDAMAGDLWVAAYLLERNALKGIKVAGEPFATAPAAIAVAKGNTTLLAEINRAIQQLQTEGKTAAIRERWRPHEMMFVSRGKMRNILLLAWSVAGLILVVGMGGWISTLRRQITKRKQAEEGITLLQSITMDVATASDLPAALEVVVRRICEKTGWALGQAWVPKRDGSALDCCSAWFSPDRSMKEFRAISKETTLKSGVGLPGRVWESRTPVWLPDVTRDSNFPRGGAAASSGLKAGLAVPIIAGEEVLAVLEFFLTTRRPEDERLVKMISAIAAQIGLVIERKRAEEKLRWSEEQLRLLLNSTGEGIFGVDLEGHCTFCNAASLRLLGYDRQEELLGKNMHSLIAHTHADGRPYPAEECPVIHSLRDGLSTSVDWDIFWRKDGKSFPAEYWSYPIFREGRQIGCVVTFLDITDRKQAEEQARASREQLRALAGRLQAVREEERTSVAREIHDVLAQELTRLKLDLGWLRRRVTEPSVGSNMLQDKVSSMLSVVDGAITSTQKIATELRPVVLDSLGLGAAVEWQATEFQSRTGIRCHVETPPRDLPISRDAATGLFRIVQESLTNVARHAQATRVEIDLSVADGQIILSIRDNGVGIDSRAYKDRHTLGLLGMRERALVLGGELDITGQPGRGTNVTVTVPFTDDSPLLRPETALQSP